LQNVIVWVVSVVLAQIVEFIARLLWGVVVGTRGAAEHDVHDFAQGVTIGAVPNRTKADA
jgi:hypothetical protein